MSTTSKPAVQPAFRAESALDYMAPHALRALQLKRMQDVVRRAWENVQHFRSRMDELGMTADDVRSLDDVARLPLR